MKIQEYQVLSTRTAPFNAAPQNNQEFLNILGNYSMGLVGEYFEYQTALNNVGNILSNNDIDNVEAEIGDVMHYAVNLLTVLGEEFNEEFLSVKQPNHRDLDLAYGNILEIPKKHIYHGHELDKETFITSIYVVLSHFSIAYKSNMHKILDKNIAKLKKRYPEKFTTADSIARRDVN